MAEAATSSDKSAHMFGPLNFPTQEVTKCKSQFVELDDEPQATNCLLCKATYVLPTDQQAMLTHFFQEHRLVIGDVQKVASLKCYIKYWRMKFSEAPLTEYCTTLLMDCTPDGMPSKNEAYFLLSDCITEDKTLRAEIQQAKLEWVLSEQAKERVDTNFKRGCMFCRTEFSGSRAVYLKHLSEKHNIQLGRPENLVFVDQLLDTIQSNVENLICIYCEKVFKDRTVLKEHMRKKLHKRVNPNNQMYDKFYMINYLEPGRNWQQVQNEPEETEEPTGFSSGSEGEENAWSEWEGERASIICLFCTHSDKDFALLLDHMNIEHFFHFEEATKGLDFYRRVKVVNYLRRQIHLKRCVFCDEEAQDLLQHMHQKQHYKLPAQRVWDQPEFYFPTYENDSFLCNLDVNGDDEDDSDVKNLTDEMAKMR